MTTKQIMNRILDFIKDLTTFYGELSQDISNLRTVTDNVELKKTLTEKFYIFRLAKRRRVTAR